MTQRIEDPRLLPQFDRLPHYAGAWERWGTHPEVARDCHLTRSTELAIKRAGFDIVQIERESIRKAMPLTRPSIRGIAVRST